MKKRSPSKKSQKGVKHAITSHPGQAASKNKVRQPTPIGVTKVIANMRSGGISLRKAAQEAQIAPRTVLQRAGSALRKKKSGRYAAKAGDRLIRQLKIPTPEGLLEISVRGLRDASLLGRYWSSLHKYFESGNSEIQRFAGQFITDVDGVKHPLVTDPDVLNRLGSAGVVSFESIYGRTE